MQARPPCASMHFGPQRRRGDRARVPLRTSVLQLRVSGAVRRVTGDVGVDYSDAWTRGDDPSCGRTDDGSPNLGLGRMPAQIWSKLSGSSVTVMKFVERVPLVPA